MTGSGFDAGQPTGWLAEGLLCYLTVDRVHELLTAVTELSADGSLLLVDVVGQSFLDSAYFAGFLESLRAEGAGWQFGTDDPTGLGSPVHPVQNNATKSMLERACCTTRLLRRCRMRVRFCECGTRSVGRL